MGKNQAVSKKIMKIHRPERKKHKQQKGHAEVAFSDWVDVR